MFVKDKEFISSSRKLNKRFKEFSRGRLENASLRTLQQKKGFSQNFWNWMFLLLLGANMS